MLEPWSLRLEERVTIASWVVESKVPEERRDVTFTIKEAVSSKERICWKDASIPDRHAVAGVDIMVYYPARG